MSSASLATDRSDGVRTRYCIALAAIVAVGACLRIAGASGSLWFDEIWSLQNLEGLSGPGDIFWGISQDNNHFLNSLWLWIAGPHANPIAQRAMSIAFGVASIFMAARIICRDGGPVGALVAALLFATSPILVQYGSEARGYSGMIFGLLWAFDALVRFLARTDGDRPRLELALAVAIGSLSHVQMAPATIALVAAAILCIALRTRDASTTIRAAGNLGSAVLLGFAPVGLAIVAGVLNTHMIRFGDQTPFAVTLWGEGLAGTARATFGVSEFLGTAGVLICAAGVAVAAMIVVRGDFAVLTGALVFALPLAEAVARMPNVHIPRFHLACAVGLLLLVAAGIAHLWERSGPARLAALLLLAAFGIGATVDLVAFLRLGRGDYARIIHAMGNGPYATDAEIIAKRTVRFFGPRVGAHPEWVRQDQCDILPDWFLHIDDNSNTAPPPPVMISGPAACETRFRFVESAAYSGLSGFRWSIYRREGD